MTTTMIIGLVALGVLVLVVLLALMAKEWTLRRIGKRNPRGIPPFTGNSLRMNSGVTPLPPPPPVAMCRRHPEAAATCFCNRCGSPLCALCARQVMGVVLCEACQAAQPTHAGDAGQLGGAGLRVLRPLDYVDLFDEAFSLYRRNFVLIAGAYGVLVFPAQFILGYFNNPLKNGIPFPPTGPPGQPPPMPELGDTVMTLVGLLLTVFTTALGQGVLTKAIADIYLERPTSIKLCYQHILRSFFPYLGTAILSGLVTMTGTMLCCVGFHWGLFAPQCFVVEGTGTSGSVQRSFALAQGNWLRCFVIYVFILILIMIVTGAPIGIVVAVGFLPGVGASAWFTFLYAFVNAAATALVTPLQLIVFILLYFDIRVRREGFDLQLLANSLAAR